MLPGKISDISITFTPTAEGLQQANLVLTGDAGETAIPILGAGQKEVSVEELLNQGFVIGDINPNPCIDEFDINIRSKFIGDINIEIYDNNGKGHRILSYKP